MLYLLIFFIGVIVGMIMMSILAISKISALEEKVAELRNRNLAMKTRVASSEMKVRAITVFYGPFPDLDEKLNQHGGKILKT
jgi:hypothetical protein